MKCNGNHCSFERLVFIAKRLRDKRRLNANIVDNHFEVSSKTAQRDIEFIRDRFLFELEYDRVEHSFTLIKAPEPALI